MERIIVFHGVPIMADDDDLLSMDTKNIQHKQRFCHDCGVGEGEIHDFGCDMETCPFCGGQLISCGCSDGFKEDKWLEICENKGRIPYIAYPNICGKCGKIYPDMFMVSDEEWEKYIDPRERELIICRECYDWIKYLIDNKGKINQERWRE